MKRLMPTSLLLALALVAGQWAALAHSAEHTALKAHDGLCVLCVQSHSLEQAQTSHTPVWQAAPVRFTPAIHATAALVPTWQAQANIRAPPLAIH